MYVLSMVWGGVSAYHPTPLDIGDGTLIGIWYVYEILFPVMLPCFDAWNNSTKFQYHNVRPQVTSLDGLSWWQWYAYNTVSNIFAWYFANQASLGWAGQEDIAALQEEWENMAKHASIMITDTSTYEHCCPLSFFPLGCSFYFTERSNFSFYGPI